MNFFFHVVERDENIRKTKIFEILSTLHYNTNTHTTILSTRMTFTGSGSFNQKCVFIKTFWWCLLFLVEGLPHVYFTSHKLKIHQSVIHGDKIHIVNITSKTFSQWMKIVHVWSDVTSIFEYFTDQLHYSCYLKLKAINEYLQ